VLLLLLLLPLHTTALAGGREGEPTASSTVSKVLHWGRNSSWPCFFGEQDAPQTPLMIVFTLSEIAPPRSTINSLLHAPFALREPRDSLSTTLLLKKRHQRATANIFISGPQPRAAKTPFLCAGRCTDGPPLSPST
jgi:hypothetical protein